MSRETKTNDVASRLNPHLKELDVDFLYHIGFNSSMDLKAAFGDVKYICMGGSPDRMEHFIERCGEELHLAGLKVPLGMKLTHVGKSERYHMFKYGPIIAVSHGMGQPSMLILLHEMAKLMHYAGVTDYCMIRVGTCGGIGTEPGTVAITRESLNTELRPVFVQHILGKAVERSTTIDPTLSDAIIAHGKKMKMTMAAGKTLATDDFYEEQARVDGAYCDYTPADRDAFMKVLAEKGVVNIEMESSAFCAFCHRGNIPCAVVCGVLVNRLKGDQVHSRPEQLKSFQEFPMTLVIDFIKHQLEPELVAADAAATSAIVQQSPTKKRKT